MKKTLICALALVLVVGMLSGCGFDANTVATVNGEKISKDLYTFFLTQVKMQLASQHGIEDDAAWESAEIDGKKAIDAAKDKALDEIVNQLIIIQRAKDDGIKLTDDQKKTVQTQIDNNIQQSGGAEAFDGMLTENGLTMVLYQTLMNNSYIQNLYADKNITTTGNSFNEAYDRDVSLVKHILIQTVDEERQPLPDDQILAAEAKANALLVRAQNGEDFDALVADNSEDPGSKSQPDGYYIYEGSGMVAEFEAASLRLAVGEISDIVKTSFGYHIIKRYPDEARGGAQQYLGTYKAAKMQELAEKFKVDAKIKINKEVYDEIK